MNKIDLFYGFLIGIATALVGSYLFIVLFTEYDFAEGYQILKEKDQLGKVITLGATLNLIAFFTLLKLGRELMARGIILATIILAFFTLLV